MREHSQSYATEEERSTTHNLARAARNLNPLQVLKTPNNMFGFKHIQFDAMTYVMHYKNGAINQEGRGLSFFYFTPNSSIVAIPMGGNDLPFV